LTEPTKSVDFIQIFVTSKKELEENLNELKLYLNPKGLLWVTYPKGTSKIKIDINRDIIREYAKSIKLEGVAMISIDDTWSALRMKLSG
jgi:ACT domain-containing protein